MRVYIPATIAMLRRMVADGKLSPVSGTAFAVTPALRESYASGNTEELEYAAMADAARASLRLLAGSLDESVTDYTGGSDPPGDVPDPVRRVVVCADVEGVRLRPELDYGAVTLPGPVPDSAVAAVYVDLPEASDAVRAAAAVIDAADMGDPDAEFTVGDADDHDLAWYAPQEVPFLLELL
ncbi:MAG TPA: hypothetical protein VGD67_05690 [Pseudonocardiaceae bacterium]